MGGSFAQMLKGSKILALGSLSHFLTGISPMAPSWVAGEREPRPHLAPGGRGSEASPSALRRTLGPQGSSHIL